MATRRIGNIDIIGDLLFKGADINVQNLNQDTALHIAVENGNSELAEYLKKLVNCGPQEAESCTECPKGNVTDWCSGDCHLKNEECVLKKAGKWQIL